MAGNDDSQSDLTAQLERASEQLKNVEERLVSGGDVDLRVLSDFRESVNHIRHTSWAVQKWVQEKHKSGGDPFRVLGMLVAERVRVATKLIGELVIDAESGELNFETPGVLELAGAVDQLAKQLRSYGKSSP
jgi:hypothetical protein